MIDAGDPTVSETRKRGSTILTIVKIAISATILLALYIKFRSQLPAITSVDVGAIALASALLLIQPILIGIRWRQILIAYHMRRPTLALIKITWISVFANQFLPAGVGGDAIRMYYARRTEVPVKIAVVSVVVDRIMALVALALLIVVFITFLDGLIERRLAISLGAMLLAGLTVAYLLARWLERPLPARLEASVMATKLLAILRFILVVLNNRVNCSIVLANAIGVHILSALAFLLIARALGIDQSAFTIMAVALILTLVQMIPVSIGGWGLREMASVGLLAGYGVDGGHAALASLLLGVAYLIASLPGAVLWLFSFKGVSIGKVSAG